MMATTWLGHGLALAFALLAAAASIAAALSRTHFVMSIYAMATAVFAALTLLLLSAGQAALALLIVGGGLTPVVLLSGVLLSSRKIGAKGRSRGFWLIPLATAAGLAMIWSGRDVVAHRIAAPALAGIGAWLAPLLFAAAASCVGLLGHGERGVLDRRADENKA
jgi:hypothetical protein